MRLGVFGGTFDPIHNAHLALARAAMGECRLDEVLFIPAARPPHRTNGPWASYADRLNMVELACAGEAGFVPSRLEEGEAVSYSITTIAKLKLQCPGAQLFFLIGADAFAEIRTWKNWHELLAMTDFLVAGRPGAQYDIPAGARVHAMEMESDISSSRIRESLAEGSAHLPVPAAVERYIFEQGLYASHNTGKKSGSDWIIGS